MTSYQRLKRNVAYLRQVERDLRDLALSLAEQMGLAGNGIRLPLGTLNGDDFLTPYNTGEFDMEILRRCAHGQHRRKMTTRGKKDGK